MNNSSVALRPLFECTEETALEGHCWGHPICGYCYNEAVKQDSFTYHIFNLVTIGVLLPAIGFFGLIGNLLSAFTYSRQEMRSSLNMYLLALACSDTVIILTSYFLFFLESLRKRSESATWWFAVLSPGMFPVGLTAQTLSVYITMASALDCFVHVAATPKFTRKFCTINTSLLILSLIVLFSLVYNAPHLFEIYVIDCWSVPYSSFSKDVCPSELRANADYGMIYYTILYSILMAVGPVITLICINSAIVMLMRRNPQEGSNSDIVTLVLVVCLFISCNVLPMLINILELTLDYFNPYLFDLSNLMVVLNSSCNFLIYYAFGSNFRRTLKYYLSVAIQKRTSPRCVLIKIPPPERLI